MKKTLFSLFLVLLIIVLPCLAESTLQLDLSKTSHYYLDLFVDEIDTVINKYHKTSSVLESELLAAVKTTVASHFINQGIDISWAWFDYTYTKEGDYCTLTTHIDYRDSNGKSQSPSVYAELFPNDNAYEIYYLLVGEEVLIDNRSILPDTIWYNKPEAFISQATGLNLTDYSKADLQSFKAQAEEEIKTNHEPNSTIKDVVFSLTTSYVEKYFSEKDATVSWPWFDYTYTNNWGLYTLTTPITVKDNAGKNKIEVYSEAYPVNQQYALIFLSLDNETIIDNRELIDRDVLALLNQESMPVDVPIETIEPVITSTVVEETPLPTETAEPVVTTEEESQPQPSSSDVSSVDVNSKETIRNVQEALNSAGYPCGTPDGIIGNKTKAAISQYRQEHALASGDYIDIDLLSSLGLIDKLDEVPTNKTTSKNTKGLRIDQAHKAFQYMGDALYPYGFECHWYTKTYEMEQYEDGSWWLKVGVTITNAFGAKRDTIAEAYINVTKETVENFYVY